MELLAARAPAALLLVLLSLSAVGTAQDADPSTTTAAATSSSTAAPGTTTTAGPSLPPAGLGDWHVVNETDPGHACIHMRAKIAIELQFELNDGSNTTQTVGVPADAVVTDGSFCDSDAFQHRQRIVLDLFNDTKTTLTMDFADNNEYSYTKLGSAGWMQFALCEVRLKYDLSDYDEFKDAKKPVGTLVGKTDGKATDTADNWRRLYSAVEGHWLSCDKQLRVNVMSSALSTTELKLVANGNIAPDAFPGEAAKDVCYADKQQDDMAAVIIGALETVALLAIMIGYLVYLKKRGPVTVPNYLIEPAMRKARVKAMSQADYNRRVSHLSVPEGPQQRRTGGSQADKEAEA